MGENLEKAFTIIRKMRSTRATGSKIRDMEKEFTQKEIKFFSAFGMMVAQSLIA